MNHAKTLRFSLLACLLLVASGAGQAQVAPVDAREKVVAVGRALLGTTEKTGRNDGPQIDRILESVGLEKTGAPYCAAFNRYCYDTAGLRGFGPRSALAAVWVREPTWTRLGGGKSPLPGDTWGIYFPSKKRVAHTGLVEKWGPTFVLTIEGNTSPDAAAGSEADRNGDGIWRKRRLVSQIYAVRNWIGE